MAKAMWKGVVLAASDKIEIVEGTVYFRQYSVKCEYFKDGTSTIRARKKSKAAYFDSVVSGEVNRKVE